MTTMVREALLWASVLVGSFILAVILVIGAIWIETILFPAKAPSDNSRAMDA